MYAPTIEGQGPEVLIGLTGLRSAVGGVSIQRDHVVRISLPEAVTIDHLGTMRQDLSEILRIATDEPDALVELQNAALRNDFPTVNRLAERIGLTEAKLSAAGGGKLGEVAIVAIIIGILIVASPSEPEQPHPSPPPTPPEHPDAGGGDGGDGG